MDTDVPLSDPPLPLPPPPSDDNKVGELLSILSQPTPDLLDKLKADTASQPDLQKLVLAIGEGNASPHFSYVDGLIFYDRRILLSSTSPWKATLLHEHHSTLLAGHPGYEHTFKLLAVGFYWPTMRRDVKQFVVSCAVCQSMKYSTQKPAGLL